MAFTRKAFEGALEKTNLDTIMAALNMQKASRQWTKDGGQYIPYPATWLNAEGWDDEETKTNVPNGLERYAGLMKLMEETQDEFFSIQ